MAPDYERMPPTWEEWAAVSPSTENEAVGATETLAAVTGRAGAQAVIKVKPIGAILTEVHNLIGRYVVATEEQLTTLALHTAHTHAFAAADTTLYINVTSAAPESGKTRVFEVLIELVRSPFNVVDPSTASLFRMVDAFQSTVLMDEIDVVFSGAKEERARVIGLLNAGYRRGASIPRVLDGSKDARPPKLFSIFSPKLFAGIGTALPPATLSRCATIRLKMKKPGEEAARLRIRIITEEARPLREQLSAWASDPGLIAELIAARPEMPEGLRDRQMDAWEPLFAIADLAGGGWPVRARTAALALSPDLQDGGQAVGVRLLHDLREILEPEEERVHLKDLAYRLNLIEDAAWGGWSEGKGISSREISRILKPFDLETTQIKIDGSNGKGYEVSQFADAFERYLLPPGNPGEPNPQLLGYPAGQGIYSGPGGGTSETSKTASDQDGNPVTEGNGDLGYRENEDAFRGNRPELTDTTSWCVRCQRYGTGHSGAHVSDWKGER
jgi:hypothetical protein